MKIFILFILISHSAFGAISMAIIERTHAKNAEVKVYQNIPFAEPKTVLIEDLKKITALENCELFNLNRDTIREIIYFNEDGSIRKIDFHMGDKFEVKSFEIKVKPHAEILSDPNDLDSPIIKDPSDKERYDKDVSLDTQVKIEAEKLKSILESQ